MIRTKLILMIQLEFTVNTRSKKSIVGPVKRNIFVNNICKKNCCLATKLKIDRASQKLNLGIICF